MEAVAHFPPIQAAFSWLKIVVIPSESSQHCPPELHVDVSLSAGILSLKLSAPVFDEVDHWSVAIDEGALIETGHCPGESFVKTIQGHEYGKGFSQQLVLERCASQWHAPLPTGTFRHCPILTIHPH